MGFSLTRPPFQMLTHGKQSGMWVARSESAYSNKNTLNEIWKAFCLCSESSGKAGLKERSVEAKNRTSGHLVSRESHHCF